MQAYLFVEVGDHGGDGERETHSLEGVHGVPVEQEGQAQGQDLAAQADQRAVQSAELGDRHEHEHL